MALNLPLMVIGLATVLVSGWSFYNGKRFAGRERRRAPGRVMGDALALHFGVQPADLSRWQRSRRLLVRHDIRGLVTGVETEFGVDKVDRRPADHADPLPWIEGLVVAWETAEEPSVHDTPRPPEVKAKPAVKPESAAKPESAKKPAPAAKGQPARKSAMSPVSGFDPAMLADLGLFDDEPTGSGVDPQQQPDEAAPETEAFDHSGRVYYF